MTVINAKPNIQGYSFILKTEKELHKFSQRVADLLVENYATPLNL